jgi:hypothetical protein
MEYYSMNVYSPPFNMQVWVLPPLTVLCLLPHAGVGATRYHVLTLKKADSNMPLVARTISTSLLPTMQSISASQVLADVSQVRQHAVNNAEDCIQDQCPSVVAYNITDGLG